MRASKVASPNGSRSASPCTNVTLPPAGGARAGGRAPRASPLTGQAPVTSAPCAARALSPPCPSRWPRRGSAGPVAGGRPGPSPRATAGPGRSSSPPRCGHSPRGSPSNSPSAWRLRGEAAAESTTASKTTSWGVNQGYLEALIDMTPSHPAPRRAASPRARNIEQHPRFPSPGSENARISGETKPGRSRCSAWLETAHSGTRDERILAIAGVQRGRVARCQLRGRRNRAEHHRLGSLSGTLLRRVHSGVFAVGPDVAIPLADETAALLAVRPGAALSHHTAAILWQCAPRRWATA